VRSPRTSPPRDEHRQDRRGAARLSAPPVREALRGALDRLLDNVLERERGSLRQGFSTARMEEIVRTVTQRELDLIVRLGYWLGGLVGLIAFGLNQLLR
jgi:uncharacterized membrane protein YheB (UPF0754 family)